MRSKEKTDTLSEEDSNIKRQIGKTASLREEKWRMTYYEKQREDWYIKWRKEKTPALKDEEGRMLP